jgi:1,2-dihydroxy-3-keto-5-methylthiopentene dioxygenase
MSRLVIRPEDDPSAVLVDATDGAAIAEGLKPIGVSFERWRADTPLADHADDQAVLTAYATEIERLKAMGGYQSMDVVRMAPDNPAAPALRAKFLSEHTHADDEVRFFVEGEGQFYLHKDGRVFAVLCEAGDLISVPAGTPHWFDAGEKPRFAAIRLFVSPAGWVANYTGSAIAERFPKFETVG